MLPSTRPVMTVPMRCRDAADCAALLIPLAGASPAPMSQAAEITRCIGFYAGSSSCNWRNLCHGDPEASPQRAARRIKAEGVAPAEHWAFPVVVSLSMPPLDTKSLLGCQRFSSVAADTAMAAITLQPIAAPHPSASANDATPRVKPNRAIPCLQPLATSTRWSRDVKPGFARHARDRGRARSAPSELDGRARKGSDKADQGRVSRISLRQMPSTTQPPVATSQSAPQAPGSRWDCKRPLPRDRP
jgi:hypothetical protein